MMTWFQPPSIGKLPLDEVAQSSLLAGLEHFQKWSIHNFSGQHVQCHRSWGQAWNLGLVSVNYQRHVLCVESSTDMLAMVKILLNLSQTHKPSTLSLVHCSSWNLARSVMWMQAPLQMRGGSKVVMDLKYLRWTYLEKS